MTPASPTVGQLPIVALHEPIRITATERMYALAYLERTGATDVAWMLFGGAR